MSELAHPTTEEPTPRRYLGLGVALTLLGVGLAVLVVGASGSLIGALIVLAVLAGLAADATAAGVGIALALGIVLFASLPALVIAIVWLVTLPYRILRRRAIKQWQHTRTAGP